MRLLMTITTPSMGLQKPEVSITDGPAWATAINASLDTLDTHDHSTNSGVKITPAGLNINADLTLNTNYTTNAGGYQFSLSSTPTLDNVIYVNSNGDLQYKNTFGDFPIITSSGDIGGGFTGDYATTTAEANYDDASKTYRFWQDTDLTANISTGSINIYENILAANPITLQSPASLASAYSLTLPTALAGGNNRAIISSSLGVLSYNDQELLTTSAATFATVDTGQGANELYAMNQNVQTTDAVTFASVDTGQGANELYAMDQNVRTTDSVTFANVSSTLNSIDYSALTQAEVNQIANINTSTISITQWGYLGNTDQDIATTSAVTFATVNTGQGANELYAMNQDVQTTDSVTFANVSATLNSVDYSALTQAEINQIANIDLTTISATQWGYVGNLNQDLTTTSNVTFNDLTTNGTFNPATISTGALTCTTIDTGQGANEVYAMNQNVRTTDNVTFNDLTTTGTFSPGTISTGAITCTTIDTGQGANEVYAMDQAVRTTDDVTFNVTLHGDGTELLPGIAFSGDTNTGIYRTTADVLRISAAGSQVANFSSGGINPGADGTLNLGVGGGAWGRIFMASGSAAAPSYTFGTDADTGLYNSATNTITFVTGGSDRWRVSSAGDLTSVGGTVFNSDGTESLPSYAFGNDTNTGFYRSAADEISFSNGGVRTWRITSAGDIVALDDNRVLGSDGSASAPSFSFINDSNTGIFRVTTDELGFTAGGVNTATVTNSALEVNLSNNSYFFFGTSSPTNTIFSAYSNVGGAFTQKWRVEADGDTISATGSYTSDERAKKNLKDIEYGLNEILQLKPQAFRWLTDADDEVMSFCISTAQVIEKIMPEMVRDDGVTIPGQEVSDDVRNGKDKRLRYKAVYEKEVVAVMVKAMQELNDIVDDISKRLEKLEKKDGEV